LRPSQRRRWAAGIFAGLLISAGMAAAGPRFRFRAVERSSLGVERSFGTRTSEPFEKEFGKQRADPFVGGSTDRHSNPDRGDSADLRLIGRGEGWPGSASFRDGSISYRRFSTTSVGPIAPYIPQTHDQVAAAPTLHTGTVSSIVLTPDSPASFRSVFGTDPSTAQLREVSALNNHFRGEGATLESDSHFGKAQLFDVLYQATKQNELVALVGHAVPTGGGLQLVLPDGERVDRVELERAFPGKLVFITCFSEDLAPRSAISLREAWSVYKNAYDWTKASDTAGHSSTSSPATDDNEPSGRQHTASLDRFVQSADGALPDHPRVRLAWGVTKSESWSLAEVYVDPPPPGGVLLGLAPAIVGNLSLVLIVLLMATRPDLPKSEDPPAIPAALTFTPLLAFRGRLRFALVQRRRTLAVAGLGLVLSLTSVGLVAVMAWLERRGCHFALPAEYKSGACLGLAQATLSYAVASFVPSSMPTRILHGLAGAIVGLWFGVFRMVRLVGTLLNAFLALGEWTIRVLTVCAVCLLFVLLGPIFLPTDQFSDRSLSISHAQIVLAWVIAYSIGAFLIIGPAVIILNSAYRAGRNAWKGTSVFGK
jgi:hypothetical protein